MEAKPRGRLELGREKLEGEEERADRGRPGRPKAGGRGEELGSSGELGTRWSGRSSPGAMDGNSCGTETKERESERERELEEGEGDGHDVLVLVAGG